MRFPSHTSPSADVTGVSHPRALTPHLFALGELERVQVAGAELHEAHVGRLRQLRDDVRARKQPEARKRGVTIQFKQKTFQRLFKILLPAARTRIKLILRRTGGRDQLQQLVETTQIAVHDQGLGAGYLSRGCRGLYLKMVCTATMVLQSASVSSPSELELSLLTITTLSARLMPARSKSSKLSAQKDRVFIHWICFTL